MYPFVRLALLLWSENRRPKTGPFDTQSIRVTCLPWDIDGFVEMNNGRILTLYDLGRFGLSVRTGLADVLRRESWGLVVAGSSVRYRARVRPFQRVELRTRLLGWDDKFFYIEQAMIRGETVCNHALLRTGITENGRLVDPLRVAEAMAFGDASPALPDWVTAWAAADRTRPWPPEL